MQIDKSLFEDMVPHFEKRLHLAPLTAKVYSLLMFDYSGSGVSFEEIVEILHASKSSVSHSIQVLLQSKYISYFNRMHDRKRYFKVNPEYSEQRFNEIVLFLKKEKNIIEKLIAHKASLNVENPLFDTKINIYNTMLCNNIASIEDALRQFYSTDNPTV